MTYQYRGQDGVTYQYRGQDGVTYQYRGQDGVTYQYRGQDEVNSEMVKGARVVCHNHLDLPVNVPHPVDLHNDPEKCAQRSQHDAARKELIALFLQIIFYNHV